MGFLDSIPEHAVSLDYLSTGSFERKQYGEYHTKIAFCTIIAQAVTGAYEIECERGGGRTSGGVFCAQAGEFLKIYHHGDPSRDNVMAARWLHISVSIYHVVDLMSLFDIPVIISREQARPFAALLEDICSVEGNSVETGLKKREYAYGLLRLLCSCSKLNRRGGILLSGLPRLRKLFTFLDRHYAHQLNVEDMAEKLFISRSRLFGLFREFVGVSPLEYLKRVRVRKATDLLVMTDKPVYEISEEVGFENPYHFGREFKKIMGIPPGRYRKTYI